MCVLLPLHKVTYISHLLTLSLFIHRTSFPTTPPVNVPTPPPTPLPTPAPLPDLVPSPDVSCPAGYQCLQNFDYGVDDPATPYKIDLVTETLYPESAEAYKIAIDHWQQIVIGNLESVSTEGMEEDSCSAPLPLIIDDMHICGKDTIMDGVGGTLGLASATYVRSTDGTVISGDMEFDSDDVQAMIGAKTWLSVIIHESKFCLSFGVYACAVHCFGI